VRIARAAPALALALVCLLARAAEPEGPNATDTSEAPARDSRATAVPRQARHRSTAQGFEDRVRRLAKGLDLDAAQEAKLRALLDNERRQIARIRSGGTQPDSERVGATLAVIDHTREEIRAMLNEEQRKKYPAAVPRELLGAPHADVEYWTRLTQSKQQGTDKPDGTESPKSESN
jgi:Spy/CpxP family protein refolding chaperone